MIRFLVDHVSHTEPDKCCCKEFNNCDDAMAYYDELTEPLREYCTNHTFKAGMATFYYRLPSTEKLGGDFADSYIRMKAIEVNHGSLGSK